MDMIQQHRVERRNEGLLAGGQQYVLVVMIELMQCNVFHKAAQD